MPELPEVETIVRDLARLVTGAAISSVEVLRPDLIEGATPDAFGQALKDARIGGVSRRAKNIVVDLGDRRLIVNLGMTGRLLVVPAEEPTPPHAGVRFILRDGRILLYHDVRRFGRLELMTAEAWAARADALGFEPLDESFSPRALYDLAHRSRVAIKTRVMDQKRVVGVGNIYASEALFRARIDPRTPANTVTMEQATSLHAAIRATLQEAIDFRGTTLLDYRDAEGGEGGFASRLLVYDREGEPCPRCATPISRIVQGGRSTFFCEKCQR
jgi:formamidopyrimidine-DNA glycosylase